MGTESERSGQHPEHQLLETHLSLLLFFFEHQRVCVSQEDIWQAVWRSDFDNQMADLLIVNVHKARKVMKKMLPEKNWHLASVRNHRCYIFCQGVIGQTIPLPQLYDFSHIHSELTTRLRLFMEWGILAADPRINPRFNSQEARILLCLARNSGRIVSFGTLKSSSETDFAYQGEGKGSLRVHIYTLRQKLEQHAPDFQLRSEPGVGYILE